MYIYNINYPKYEEELCALELRYVFGEEIIDKTFMTSKNVNPDRSPFIKYGVEILQTGESFEALLEKVSNSSYALGTFKVKFVGESCGIDFSKRHELEGEIAYVIKGIVDVKEPDTTIGIMIFKNQWIFGKYHKNNGYWRMHELKPYSYSHALNTRIARALVNIAIKDDLDARIIDPCCGIGTVVIEGLSMGINIVGYEINPKVVANAKKNLTYFEYNDAIKRGDLHELNEYYDCAIIDLPYGISSPTDNGDRREIIRSVSRLSNRMVIVSIEDIDDYIKDTGFVIMDKCQVSKMRFKRQIFVCEKSS